MPIPLLVANWKMNKTVAAANQFIDELLQDTLPVDRTVVICASYTALAFLQTRIGEQIQYGAQNIHWEESGAYTGEISAAQLVELGCRYVIVGHSERRRDQHETDVMINKKAVSALRHKLQPIICVGESLQQRQAGVTTTIVSQQLEAALAGIPQQQYDKLVIAYEPIWAIGTGQTATAKQAQQVHGLIRHYVGAATPIVYGGSVTPDTIGALMAQPDIDGGLVGGASLDVEQFLSIIHYVLDKTPS